MSDTALYTCPLCGQKIPGRAVTDPGLPAAIEAHKLRHVARTANEAADVLEARAFTLRRAAYLLDEHEQELADGEQTILLYRGRPDICGASHKPKISVWPNRQAADRWLTQSRPGNTSLYTPAPLSAHLAHLEGVERVFVTSDTDSLR